MTIMKDVSKVKVEFGETAVNKIQDFQVSSLVTLPRVHNFGV